MDDLLSTVAVEYGKAALVRLLGKALQGRVGRGRELLANGDDGRIILLYGLRKREGVGECLVFNRSWRSSPWTLTDHPP